MPLDGRAGSPAPAGALHDYRRLAGPYKMGLSGLKIAKAAGLSSPMIYLIIKKTGASK
jgi:hypothetical protein